MSIDSWNIDGTWTLFLDRDGVINERIMGDYVKSPDEFVFLEGVKEAIALLSRKFNRVIVVTNQQGVGKGIMTERNLLEIHTYMSDEVYRAGGKIDKCYFAPALAGDESDDMRKPKTGMAELARMEFPEIEFSRSVMVGDSDTDIEFGRKLGMKTVRVKTVEPIGTDSDLTVDSLKMFAKIVENEA